MTLDSEIVLFGAIGIIGGAMALVLAHFYYLPKVENDAREPALYELTQRDRILIEPARR